MTWRDVPGWEGVYQVDPEVGGIKSLLIERPIKPRKVGPFILQPEGEKRNDFDFYPTPLPLCQEVLKQCLPEGWTPANVLDPGAGGGPWGRAAREMWPNTFVMGLDIRPEAQGTDDYDVWETADYLTAPNDMRFDLIIGNPPFKLMKEFILHSMDLLRPEGQLLFLARIAILNSDDRYRTLYSMPGLQPYVVHILVQRPSFIAVGPKAGNNGADDYVILHFVKGYAGRPVLNWLNWR